MKLLLPIILALGLHFPATFGYPTEPQSTPVWFKFAENELGPVYSSAPPTERSTSWYQVSENENGPVYSSIPPASITQRAQPASGEIVADYEAWVAEE
jgi:hypothetical protein